MSKRAGKATYTVLRGELQHRAALAGADTEAALAVRRWRLTFVAAALDRITDVMAQQNQPKSRAGLGHMAGL